MMNTTLCYFVVCDVGCLRLRLQLPSKLADTYDIQFMSNANDYILCHCQLTADKFGIQFMSV
jgi:hypothetical protein